MLNSLIIIKQSVKSRLFSGLNAKINQKQKVKSRTDNYRYAGKKIILVLFFVLSGKFCYGQAQWDNFIPVSATGDTLGGAADVVFDKNNNPWMIGVTKNTLDIYLFGRVGGIWQSYFIYPFQDDIFDNSIAIDTTNDIIWIGAGTLVSFNISTQMVSYHFIPADHVSVNPLTHHVFFSYSTSTLISEFDGTNFTDYPDTVTGATYFPYPLLFDTLGKLFFMSAGSITKYDGSQWVHYDSSNISALSGGYAVYKFFIDQNNNVILLASDVLGADCRIIKFDGINFITVGILNYDNVYNITRLLPDELGNIWMYSENKELIKYDGYSFSFYPFSSTFNVNIFPTFNIDVFNSIWIGQADYGQVYDGFYRFNENGFSNINGTIYNDTNQNGIQDAGENGLANETVYTNEGYLATTDSSGNYYLYFTDSAATVTVAHQLKQYRVQTSLPITYSVNPATQTTAGYNFGVYTLPNVKDAIVNAGISAVRPGFNSYGYINYFNAGTVALTDTVELVYDNQLTFTSSSIPPDVNSNNILKWGYQNLQPLTSGNITLDFYTPPTTPLGDTINLTASIYPIATDTAPANNVYEFYTEVIGSFDPNMKDAFPRQTTITNDWIYYTIYFQNTGTDTAFNIFVLDTLDQNLQLNTFEYMGASHPCTFNMMGAGYLRFNFSNILLPDSNVNEPLSHGYITYRVKSKAGLPIGTQIQNTAFIYFDFNVPVVTNTATTEIISPVGVSNLSDGISDVSIQPNPASSIVNISSKKLKQVSFHLYDLTGRTVLKTTATFTNNKTQLDISHLQRGVYTLMVSDAKNDGMGFKNLKVVKW